jgi:hypothetical protein
MLGGVVTLAGVADAQARPTGGCWDAEVRSTEASACREHGWTIERRLVIGPRNRAWTTLPRCESEDSSMCFWNARLRGNGLGRSFIDYGCLGTYFGVVMINGRLATPWS